MTYGAQAISMRKSTEYGFGGAALLVAGLNIAIAPLLAGGFGTTSPELLWISVPVAIALGSVGAYWLVQAQGFYHAETRRPVGRLAAP
jgi:hypothetical protein